MMDAPKIGQQVRLNSPKSLEHGRLFEVVAVHPSGKFADIKSDAPHAWKVYTEPLNNLMHPDWRAW